MKKLKICYIGWANSIHVERWVKWFADRGHEVHLITDAIKEIEGVFQYDIKTNSTYRSRLERYIDLQFNINNKHLKRIGEIFRLRKLIKKIKPVILHSFSLWYPGYLGVYSGFHPYVITVLDGDVLWVKDNTNLFTKLRTKYALTHSDYVVGESEHLISAAVKTGVRKERAAVNKIGVDKKYFYFKENKEEAKKLLGLEGCKVVLSPRSISPFYNIDLVLNTVKEVSKNVKNVKYVFLGHHVDEKYFNELKDKAMKNGVDRYCSFIGKVDYITVAKYHQASDVFISLSPKDSGPMALQEAMACGAVPVISDLPSVKELIQDGFNGLLVNPNNGDQIVMSVIKLLDDDEMRNNYVQKNRKIAQEMCDQEKEMNKMESMYYQVIEDKKG